MVPKELVSVLVLFASQLEFFAMKNDLSVKWNAIYLDIDSQLEDRFLSYSEWLYLHSLRR